MVAADLVDLLHVVLGRRGTPGSLATSRMVRRAQSRMKTRLVASKSTALVRSSKARSSREATDTPMIAAMKQAPIFTPSGRSMTLPTVV